MLGKTKRKEDVMPQITNHNIKKMQKALDETYFTAASFNANFPDAGNTFAQIRFIDNTNYVFTFSEYRSQYKVEYTPASVKWTSTFATNDFDDVIKSLGKWAENIRNEIIASTPFYQEFENLKEVLNKTIDERFANSAETFTREEIEALRVQLNLLTEQFEALHNKHAITEKELAKIKETVENLKEDVKHFPKKSWYRSASQTLLNLASKIASSKVSQEMLEAGARKLLGLPGQTGQ